MPSVTNRCSSGSDSSSAIVIACGSSKTGIASVLAEVDASFAFFVPLKTHDFRVRTLCADVKKGEIH